MKKDLSKYCFYYFAIFLLLTGCGGDGETGSEHSLNISPNTITISADAGKGEFTLEASASWTISDIPEWCSYVRPSFGQAGKTIVTIGGKFYDNQEDRHAELTVQCGPISKPIFLIQKGKCNILLTPESFNDISQRGGDFSVKIETNITYTIDIQQEGNWLEIIGSKPIGNGTLNFSILPNSSTKRSATIIFRDTESDFTQELNITQLGDPILEERSILNELFEATNGQTWTKSDGWGTDAPVDKWFGVTVENDRITAIELPNNNLTGQLPVSIGNLSALKKLVLSGNRLSGSLPSKLRLNPNWKTMDAAISIYPQMEGYGFTLSDGEVTCWQLATKGGGVDVVFLGDGFTQNELILGKGFDEMVTRSVEYLFGVEPMTLFRNYFNVYSVAAVSQQSGIGTMGVSGLEKKDTKFETYFTAFIGPGMTTNEQIAYSYVSKAPIKDPTRTIVIMLVNTTRYGGITMAWPDNRAISICSNYPDNSQENPYGLAGLIRHEVIGHGFAKLDEEYIGNLGSTPSAAYIRELQTRHARGHSLNIDTKGDQETVCWKKFIGLQGYEEVGLYEGAGNYQKGVWRPESASCMVDNQPYFNAPSREIIFKRIKELAGEVYDFNEFLKQDKGNVR